MTADADQNDRSSTADQSPAISGSRSRLAPLVALPVAVLLIAFIAVLATRIGAGEERAGSSPLDGRIAPTLAGPTIDGGDFDLDRWRGRWVVVNFFSTACPPCIAEHPEFVQFANRHADGDRRLVSVLFNEPNPDPVREFFAANAGSWPVVTDSGGEVAVSYAVASVPETVIVSPSGLVAGKITGQVTADQLDELIDRLEGT